MSFYARLVAQTASARMGLLGTPIIQGCLNGDVSLPSYTAFLTEAYHHVSHTVPLMQAFKARLPAGREWLEGPLDEYIDEEAGHDEWILDDLRALIEAGDCARVVHRRHRAIAVGASDAACGLEPVALALASGLAVRRQALTEHRVVVQDADDRAAVLLHDGG